MHVSVSECGHACVSKGVHMYVQILLLILLIILALQGLHIFPNYVGVEWHKFLAFEQPAMLISGMKVGKIFSAFLTQSAKYQYQVVSILYSILTHTYSHTPIYTHTSTHINTQALTPTYSNSPHTPQQTLTLTHNLTLTLSHRKKFNS